MLLNCGSLIIDFHVEVGYNIYHDVCLNVEDLINEMKRYNISYAVITPAYGVSYICEFIRANREIINITNKYKNLIGFAVVNPWVNEHAINELKEVLSKYKLRGVKLNPYLQGFSINHPIVYPIAECIVKYKVPLYIPSGYHPQTPLEIADLADVFPELIVVMGFAGFSDFWMEVIPAMRKRDNIYADISCQTNIKSLKKAIEYVGSDRFLFASSLPYSSPKLELEKMKLLDLKEEDREAILWKNAKRLLRL